MIVLQGKVYLRCCSGDAACAINWEDNTQAEEVKEAIAMLQDLLTVVDIDMQFFMTFGDEPLTSRALYANVPVFHPAGSDAYWTIPWPSIYHTRALFREELSNKSLGVVSWEDKVSKAWWRGSLIAPSTTLITTAKFLPRVRLMRIAAQDPELFDVAFTSVHPTLAKIQWTEQAVKMVLRESRARLRPYEDFWSHAPWYKFLLIIPGVTQSHQLTNVLRSGSVPFIVSDSTFEHLHPLLTPWTHFVPIRADLADLVPALNLLRADDALARIIAGNAKELAQGRLQPTATYCYLWRALRGLRDLAKDSAEALHQAVGKFEELPRLDLRRKYPDFKPIRDRLRADCSSGSVETCKLSEM